MDLIIKNVIRFSKINHRCFFSLGQEPNSLKSVFGFYFVRLHSKVTERSQNCCKKLRSDNTEMTLDEIFF